MAKNKIKEQIKTQYLKESALMYTTTNIVGLILSIVLILIFDSDAVLFFVGWLITSTYIYYNRVRIIDKL